jgi:hypothetical protein
VAWLWSCKDDINLAAAKLTASLAGGGQTSRQLVLDANQLVAGYTYDFSITVMQPAEYLI